MTKFNKKDVALRMKKTIDNFQDELKGVRVGRASPILLEKIMVKSYGASMPLRQVSSVTAADARTLLVSVWDVSLTGKVDKAIQEADLGLNPQVEGNNIRISVPILSEQRRKELVKLSHKIGENYKIAIRNIRREEITEIKSDDSLSKDMSHDFQTEVQLLTDTNIKEVDAIIKQKEKEIMD